MIQTRRNVRGTCAHISRNVRARFWKSRSISTDARSGITSDPNRREEPEYIVRLVKRVVTVSVETVKLVGELAREVDVLAAVGVRAGD